MIPNLDNFSRLNSIFFSLQMSPSYVNGSMLNSLGNSRYLFNLNGVTFSFSSTTKSTLCS